MGNSNGFNAVVRNSVLFDLSALVQTSIAHYAHQNTLYFLDNHRMAVIGPSADYTTKSGTKIMSYLERALETDRIELPTCGCGRLMTLDRIERVPDHNKACTLYRCLACQQEIRLTVGAADVVN